MDCRGACKVDRDGIYRCEGVARLAEQLAGRAPQTQSWVCGSARRAMALSQDGILGWHKRVAVMKSGTRAV